MKTLCWIALALALSVVWPVAAQDLPSPPDPVRLDAQWWNYFAVSPEEEGLLQQRIDSASSRLLDLENQLPPEEWTRLRPAIDTVIASLRRYARLVATPLPGLPPTLAARDSYTLEELTALVVNLRKATVSRTAEAQDIEVLQDALAEGERAQSQRKVAYIGLDAVSPERAERGLELMQSRLQLELGKRELKFRSARLEAEQSEVDNLDMLVVAAAQRLTATPGELQRTAEHRSRAEKRAAELRERLARAELQRSGVLALAPLEQAKAQLQGQRSATIEAQALTEEATAAQAGLSEVLLAIAAGDESPDPAAHRKQLRSYKEQLESLRLRLRQIRTETLRSRSDALTRVATEELEQLAGLLRERIDAADDTDRQLAALDEQLSVSALFGDLLGTLLVASEGTVGFSVQLAKDLATGGWTRAVELLSVSLFEISETPVTSLGLLRMFLIMTIAWWISKLARRGLLSVAMRRDSINQGSIYTLSRILHYLILAVGIMVSLSSIGIDFTKFALFASALGVGIGFGLQTLVSNFVAGLIILFEKSLKVGDFVELESGVTGEVKEINMRSTLVTTNDNIDIVVPNSEFVNSRVTNWTMREVHRRIHIAFGVAYGTDKELVKKAALEAASEVDVTLTSHSRREPQVWFVGFGDSSLDFELVVWLKPDAVKRPGAVQAAYLWAIDDKLRKYHIEVPFPQRDLHLRSAFGMQDEEGQSLLRAASTVPRAGD